MMKEKKKFQLEEFSKRHALHKKRVPVFLQIKQKGFNYRFSFKTDKTNPIFKIDESDLKNGIILVPVIQNPKLYPFSYIHLTNNGAIEYAQSGNYAGYEIVYQKLHLAKIIQSFGVSVLRKDERFLEPIVKKNDKIEHFYLYDFDKQEWTVTNKLRWNLERDEIDKARRNDEVIDFFNLIFKTVETVALLEDYYEVLYPVHGNWELQVKPEIERFLTYFEFFYAFGEISHEHIDLVRGYFKKINENIAAYQALNLDQRNSKLMTLLKKITFEVGGWVRNNQFYPNFAYFISLSQPAKQYRNLESIRETTRAAVAYSNKIQKQEIMFDYQFTEFCKENGFHI
jgi:hypothetical protein